MERFSMITHLSLAWYLLFFLSSLNTSLVAKGQILQVVDEEARQTYIIHVQEPERSGGLLIRYKDLRSWHTSFLPHPAQLVYSYQHAISGFAARLTPSQVKAMEAKDGFLYAQPDRTLHTATTYTPKFLGLDKPDGAWSMNKGARIIIGVVDSGILPTHTSFNDDGMYSPPTKWKGRCGFSNFTCNNKIIGGAGFLNGERTSPVDKDGHGTHVASIAAGRSISGANDQGAAKGTASGVAPSAHLAIYKVCQSHKCEMSDTLAGVDQAIKDGVDVITMSLGLEKETNFYSDLFAIATLAAVNNGMCAVAAAGNTGPGMMTLSHTAPWVVAVGATTTDRRAVAGKGTQFGQRPSPALTHFSSRGPSAFNGGILKPDVLAPGLQVLGAWHLAVGSDPADSSFKLDSGTSMATPHVAGVMALLRSEHGAWSPAAIQSAIITTAQSTDLAGNTIVDWQTHKSADIYAMGAGQVNATAALDPGLVYDLNTSDYVGYICGLGYTDRAASAIFRRQVVCSSVAKLKPWQLNYPSIGVFFKAGFTTTTFTRTVTNVGPPESEYVAQVTVPAGVEVRLSEYEILFGYDKPKTFTFTIEIKLTATSINTSTSFRGKLQFVSSNYPRYVVTSPIAILYNP